MVTKPRQCVVAGRHASTLTKTNMRNAYNLVHSGSIALCAKLALCNYKIYCIRFSLLFTTCETIPERFHFPQEPTRDNNPISRHKLVCSRRENSRIEAGSPVMITHKLRLSTDSTMLFMHRIMQGECLTATSYKFLQAIQPQKGYACLMFSLGARRCRRRSGTSRLTQTTRQD